MLPKSTHMAIAVTSLSKIAVLILLLQKPKYGYELMKDMREKFGYKVSAGQIYPFLSGLVRAKLVVVSKKGQRDKKVYTLTPTGSAFANKALHSFEELIELAIAKKLRQCAHCGCKVFGNSYSEKINGKKLHFCCGSCANAFKTIERGI